MKEERTGDPHLVEFPTAAVLPNGGDALPRRGLRRRPSRAPLWISQSLAPSTQLPRRGRRRTPPRRRQRSAHRCRILPRSLVIHLPRGCRRAELPPAPGPAETQPQRRRRAAHASALPEPLEGPGCCCCTAPATPARLWSQEEEEAAPPRRQDRPLLALPLLQMVGGDAGEGARGAGRRRLGFLRRLLAGHRVSGRRAEQTEERAGEEASGRCGELDCGQWAKNQMGHLPVLTSHQPKNMSSSSSSR